MTGFRDDKPKLFNIFLQRSGAIRLCYADSSVR